MSRPKISEVLYDPAELTTEVHIMDFVGRFSDSSLRRLRQCALCLDVGLEWFCLFCRGLVPTYDVENDEIQAAYRLGGRQAVVDLLDAQDVEHESDSS